MKKLIALLLTCAMMLCGISAFAEEPAGKTYQTPDGVLSIQAPTENWCPLSDPNHWFALSDGINMITIGHLRNGEALPAVTTANTEYGGIYQAYVSTRNEVFCVKGCAVKEEDLQPIMKAIGTIQILKQNTKTALQENQPINNANFGLRPVNQIYYCTAPRLMIKNGWTIDSQDIGYLSYGNAVTVTAAVTLNGADYGWYQIMFSNGTGYVSAQYMSPAAPANTGTGANPTTPTTPANPGQTGRNTDDTIRPFTVYAKDGSVATIFLTPDKTAYRDYQGYTYTNLRGDLYYCHELNKEYHADPNYWTQQQSEEAASQAFTIYPKAGGTVVIQRQANGQYTDGNGNTYTQTPQGLYVCDQTNVTYSADPNYWEQQETTEAASQAFTIYPKAGGTVVIQRQANGQFTDGNGNTYTQTPQGLYVCDQTNVTYSTDPNYWSSEQEQERQQEAEIEQHAKDLGDDRPDDEQNEEDEQAELEQHAKDLGDDRPDDEQNEEDEQAELEQHAQDLGDDEPSHD